MLFLVKTLYDVLPITEVASLILIGFFLQASGIDVIGIVGGLVTQLMCESLGADVPLTDVCGTL